MASKFLWWEGDNTLSTFLTEQEWVDKKISEGYFGFDVCELDKIYSKEEIDELQKFFQYHTDGLNKEATSDIKRLVAGEHLPLKNGFESIYSAFIVPFTPLRPSRSQGSILWNILGYWPKMVLKYYWNNAKIFSGQFSIFKNSGIQPLARIS